ncbi:MAG: alpha/beta fold hydrolase, partial [Egibacteraceae bacterium]
VIPPGSATLWTMTSPPAWFREALDAPYERRAVEVEDCEISYLTWGEPKSAGLVLVHGGAAHAHWWSFLAPFLASDHRVAALDLSGHGDSGRRHAYSVEQWAAEVMAVAEDAHMSESPILVGHSMGGFVSIVAASVHGDRLAGAVIVDAPVRRPDPEREEAARGRAFKNPKTYPDLEAALTHFHLVPRQPVIHDFVVDHVALHSLKPVPGGWTWKFDPRVFDQLSSRVIHEYLADIRCRVAIFRGEFSDLVTPEVSEYMSELLGRNAPFVEIPQAHHHLLLDRPLAFVAALRAILADWEHSIPRQPSQRGAE